MTPVTSQLCLFSLDLDAAGALKWLPSREALRETNNATPDRNSQPTPNTPSRGVSLAEAMDFSLNRLDAQQAASVRNRAGDSLGWQMDLARSLFGGL